MNIKVKSMIALMALVLFSATSCNKYLTLKPQDGIIRQDFWQTKEQLAAAVNGCYASLLADPLVEKLFLWGELRGDMLGAGSGIKGDDVNVINVNINSSNGITDWSVIYKTINNCNTILDFGPGVLKSDNTLTQPVLNGYLGEAYALRALMYFYLARTFGDVPLKLKSTTSDADNLQIAKSPQADVFNQVLSDLKQAEGMVAKNYGNNDLNKGRITYYAVEATLADLYLWLNQYDNASKACDNIINSGQFTLVPGDANWFTTVYFQGNSAESIFEIQFNVNKLNPFYNMFAVSSKRFKAGLLVGSDIYTIDNVNIDNKDIRGDGAALKFSDASIYKYQGINASSTRASSASYAHWFVYRYSDILLMKAEAQNQLGNGQAALDAINVIRTRANALPSSAMVVQPTDKDGITDYLLAERAREFAFEGKRWFDLLRNARRNNYARLDLLLNIPSTTTDPQYQQAAIVKFRDQRSHYLPIFLSELQTNKALVQNPFYQ
ncbi:putative outer membrane starch-binding protein [Mucilaginibacter yixingensis]|uniref:Putative outer membrane starch-binding protein n=1 Tax=Mucilaginibacter yixingensis TaxID=1295612 RepID=A0A2T5JGW9_9SPHI|nr:RagB/SusD family nutrient uptake outer membrane protein [Mucilaginibacter yixingensis]PTR01667.1 putative outer membrane starch-binding protein [Mucilaginibacter yixingensis]